MVHALKQVQRMLGPNGLLVNVHDLPAPHLIEVHAPETTHKVGWLLDNEDFANELSAFNALAQVVGDGLYSLADQQDFGYNIYLDDLNELREWLADWWSTAVLPDGVAQHIAELTRDADQTTRIVLAVEARMILLRAPGSG